MKYHKPPRTEVQVMLSSALSGLRWVGGHCPGDSGLLGFRPSPRRGSRVWMSGLPPPTSPGAPLTSQCRASPSVPRLGGLSKSIGLPHTEDPSECEEFSSVLLAAPPRWPEFRKSLQALLEASWCSAGGLRSSVESGSLPPDQHLSFLRPQGHGPHTLTWRDTGFQVPAPGLPSVWAPSSGKPSICPWSCRAAWVEQLEKT